MAIDLYKNRCSVYEGEKPYIFVSYSHKDIEKVVSLIRKLQSLGFRVWYDSGVPAGAEWPEEIAVHLKNSGCVLSLLSANAANSRHFKEEFNYAYHLKQPILVAYLENCELTPGIEMRVVSQQCIKCEHCEDDEDLLEEIARAKILLPCLGEKPASKPEPTPEPTPKADHKLPKTKIELLREKAKNGDAQAQVDLGNAYFYGTHSQVDYEKAVEWYRKGAEQNHPDGIRRLAYCYDSGFGIRQDMSKAVSLYEKGAALGDTAAMFNLAVCYESGEGIEQNPTKAVELYKKAADLGDTDAIYNLAICYRYGKGVPRDMDMSLKLYRKAADLGDVDSQYDLAEQYAIGWYVTQNWDEAARWYRKAAEKGHAKAQKQMVECYRKGLGVPIDEEEADRWQKLYDENPKK